MEIEIKDHVMALISRIKSCIEWKDNGQITSLLGCIPLWIFDRPGSAADLIDRFEQISDGSDDMEFLFLKVITLNQNGARASLSALTQLVWTNEKTWEEEEFDAVMHMGMIHQNSEWVPEYLGFIHQESTWSSAPAKNAAAAIGNSLEIHEALHAETTYFGMASASPFLAYPVQGAGPDFKSEVMEPEADPVAPSGMVPIYVPEAILIEIVKKMNISKELKREL
jgi:hypothetical protein